jgi:hypothetical protein
MKKRTKVKIALALFSLAGLYGVYWLSFSAWMTAYPFVDNNAWKIRFYWWFLLSIVLATAWILSVIWLVKDKRKRGC